MPLENTTSPGGYPLVCVFRAKAPLLSAVTYKENMELKHLISQFGSLNIYTFGRRYTTCSDPEELRLIHRQARPSGE